MLQYHMNWGLTVTTMVYGRGICSEECFKGIDYPHHVVLTIQPCTENDHFVTCQKCR